MSPSTHRLLASAVAVVVLFAGSVLATYGHAAERERSGKKTCDTVTPHALPDYMIAGMWGQTGHRALFMVEPIERRLAMFHRGHRAVESLPRAIASTAGSMRPVGGTGLPDGGLMIELEGGRFWQLGPDLATVAGPTNVATAAGLQEVFPYRWEFVGSGLDDGGLIMCGDVRRGDDWTSGIFYVPTGPDATSEGYKEVLVFDDLRDPNRLGCRLGTQLFGVVDGVPYVMLLSGIDGEEQPEIYRIVPEAGTADRLQKVELKLPRPEALVDSPALSTHSPGSQFAALMEDIEGATMPTEMVGWNDWLFVLLRKPAKELGSGDATAYSIARIKPPVDGEAAEVVESPFASTAPHLSLVAGPETFAVVEKAHARGIGDHPVRSLRLVPSVRLENMSQGVAICN